MVRLGEAGSRDLYPVSQYYSRKLVTYIRSLNSLLDHILILLLLYQDCVASYPCFYVCSA